MLPPPGPASPVPAHRVPSEPMARAPMAWGFEMGQSWTNVLPPSVLFHTPPLAAAVYTVFVEAGSGTTSRTRPPILVGPANCHCDAARRGFRAAVAAASRPDWRAAAGAAPRGTPAPFTRWDTIQSSGAASDSCRRSTALPVRPGWASCDDAGWPLGASSSPTRAAAEAAARIAVGRRFIPPTSKDRPDRAAEHTAPGRV